MIGNPPELRADGRVATQLRPVSFELGVQKWAEGSCIVSMDFSIGGDHAEVGSKHGLATRKIGLLRRVIAEPGDKEGMQCAHFFDGPARDVPPRHQATLFKICTS